MEAKKSFQDFKGHYYHQSEVSGVQSQYNPCTDSGKKDTSGFPRETNCRTQEERLGGQVDLIPIQIKTSL